MSPSTTEVVIFWICDVYILFPMIIERSNKWLWEKRFRSINYAVTVVLAGLFFVLRSWWPSMVGFLSFFLFSPLIFYTQHWLFDRAMLYMYERHFIIVGRGMSKPKWGFNGIDMFFSTFMLVVSLILPPLFAILKR
jgi:hypothetical protein